ncbi:hypothetical protein LCGC14_2698610 [marine sediment metagenome]|uniref:Uncharacterized protein n=1 Tax=marine sediment metagenome TaxID=412755 RepID=A0A0F8ZGL4_9ZZZZ
MPESNKAVEALIALNKLHVQTKSPTAWELHLQNKATAWQQLLRYGGIKTVGNLLASRKGVFGFIAIALSYWLLLGRLPAEAAPELIAQMGEVFGMIVAVVVATVVGGTALEDALKRGATKAGPAWLPPNLAAAVGKAYDRLQSGDDEEEVTKELGKSVIKSLLVNDDSSSASAG